MVERQDVQVALISKGHVPPPPRGRAGRYSRRTFPGRRLGRLFRGTVARRQVGLPGPLGSLLLVLGQHPGQTGHQQAHQRGGLVRIHRESAGPDGQQGQVGADRLQLGEVVGVPRVVHAEVPQPEDVPDPSVLLGMRLQAIPQDVVGGNDPRLDSLHVDRVAGGHRRDLPGKLPGDVPGGDHHGPVLRQLLQVLRRVVVEVRMRDEDHVARLVPLGHVLGIDVDGEPVPRPLVAGLPEPRESLEHLSTSSFPTLPPRSEGITVDSLDGMAEDGRAPTPAQLRVGLWEALSLVGRNGQFARLFGAQLISYAGDWFATVALLGLVEEMTGSAALTTLVLVSQMLSVAVFSPVGGHLADRLNRKRLMVAADALRIVLAAGYLLIDDRGDLWLAFVLTAGIAGLSAVFTPASNAAVPNLVEPEDLPAANVLDGAAWGTMLAVGGALGGIVAAVFGRDAAFIGDAVSFALSAALLIGIRRRFSEPAGHREHPGMREAIRETGRYARRDHRVLALLTVKGGVGL